MKRGLGICHVDRFNPQFRKEGKGGWREGGKEGESEEGSNGGRTEMKGGTEGRKGGN